MLTARVHPGETNSSYMLKGAIDFLLGDSNEAAVLRKHFVVRVVPMLNPDGVVYGNYRCSLLGADLNRRWQNPSKYLHPTVFYTKRFLQYFSEEHEISMFCDMHGHSMKKNMFVYACCLRPCEETSTATNVLIKLIPKLLSKSNKLFSFKDSHFRIEPCKLSTARVVSFKEFHILNSYTLEASFYGPATRAQLLNHDPESPSSETEDSQMDTSHMESLGRDLCRVMGAFTSKKAFKGRLGEVTAGKKEEKKPIEPADEGQRDDRQECGQAGAGAQLEEMFPMLETNREQDDESFWAKVSAFEEQAYKVLYEQHISHPPPHHSPPHHPPPHHPQPQHPPPIADEELIEEPLSVRHAIEAISLVPQLPEELVKPDEAGSDEGGSDSLGSDNDDCKQEFIYRKTHKEKKGKKRMKKTVKREGKVHSCNGHVKADVSPVLTRPKTPFVSGNYPDSRARNLSRISTIRTPHAVKSMHCDSPKRRKPPSDSSPTPVLLAGYRKPEIVRGKVAIGRLKPQRVSYCPSTSSLIQNKTPDLSLRLRSNRASDASYREPRGKSGNKSSMRSFNISPV